MSSKSVNFFSLSLFFFFLLFYFQNASRAVYAGDVGDLVTAAAVGGVAHPPGYPLFTLLGFLLIKSGFFVSPALAATVVSVISGALGIFLFFKSSYKLTQTFIPSLIGALLLGFCYLYWFYAEIGEVFALNNFFAILLFFLGILYYKTKQTVYLLLLSFVFGLAMTNHHTIVLLVPSFMILLVSRFFHDVKQSPFLFLKASIFFLIGFSVYLYVPFASSRNPLINWDHVHDVGSFLHLFLRKDYGTFNAGFFAQPTWLQRVLILKTYFFVLLTQITFPAIVVIALGVFRVFKQDKILATSLLAAFLVSGPLFIVYAGFPLFGTFFLGVYERFFSLSVIFLVFFFPFGILTISTFLKPYLRKQSLVLVQLIFLLIPLLLLGYNLQKANLSSLTVGDDLGKDYLTPLPKNSVLLLSGDTVFFNAQYVHYALGVRPDVTILNISMLDKDPYFQFEKKEYQKKYPKTKGNITIDTLWYIAKKRPVFVHTQLEKKDKKENLLIPYGLSFQLANALPGKEIYLAKNEKIWNSLHTEKFSNERNLALKNLSVADIPKIYANSLLETGNFVYASYHDVIIAKKYYTQAMKVDPTNPKTYELFSVFALTDEKDCAKAERLLRKTIQLDIFEKSAYFLLYKTYTTCMKDQSKARKLTKEFSAVFKDDFFKEQSRSQKIK